MERNMEVMEKNIEVPKYLKTELTCDPIKPLLGVYPRELKSATWKRISAFLCSLKH